MQRDSVAERQQARDEDAEVDEILEEGARVAEYPTRPPSTSPDDPLSSAPRAREDGLPREEVLAWLRRAAGGEALAEEQAEALRPMLLRLHQIVLHQEVRFASMLEIGSALSSVLNVDDLLAVVVEKTTDLMDAERSSIFLIDKDTKELWSKVTQGVVNTEIRLQPGQGVAGWVAMTGKSINIRDAYLDPRFNPEIDQATGFQTRSMLCQPIRNLQGDIIGVIQVLNRRAGNFTDEDENLLSAIASQAAIAIENSTLYLSAVERNMALIEMKDQLERKVGELDLLYEIERLVRQAQTIDQLFESLAHRTLELVHASSFRMLLRDPPGGGSGAYSSHTLTDHGEWEVEWSLDIAPHATTDPGGLGQLAAETREELLFDEAGEVPLGAQGAQALDEIRAHHGLPKLENVIALPLVDNEVCIGAVEIVNTVNEIESGRCGWTVDDLKVLRLISTHMASAIGEHWRRAEEQKQNRLATIGQMLSGVLHDFKNPMTIISGYVQLLAKTDDADRRKEYAESIVNQFKQLNSMTKEVLMFARGDTSLLLRKTFMQKFMEEIRELLEPELTGRHVDLHMDVRYRGEARLDQVKMKRAVLNLARNAADAMPQGGSFEVVVERQGPGDPEADELLFTFRDSGQGIPPEIHDNLFESFVTQGKANGTGLGLAIVKKIVDDHGGSIRFETAPAQGTTFFLRLPLMPAGEAA